MKKQFLLFFITLPFLATAQMAFTENNGQFVDANGNASTILFKTTGTGPQLFITTSGITYVFQQKEKSPDAETDRAKKSWSKIEMQLGGAQVRAENVVKEDPLPGYSNYYYAHCPQGILGVKSWKKVTIRNVYPGIDWVLSADPQKGLAHDFIVHPGADARQIRLYYRGTEAYRMDFGASQLEINVPSAFGTLHEGALRMYEKESGALVDAGYDALYDLPGCLNLHEKKTPSVEISYSIPDLSPDKTYIIDPPLQWSMPQASSDFDYGYAIAAAKDNSGDVLLTGATDGTNFPVLNAYQGQLYGFEDLFVQRLNSSGARVWSTYYGGTDYEQGRAIASDNSGNCYVTGTTGSNDFPVLNPLQANYGNGVYDLAILKFNAAGARQWATWYGSFGNEYGTGIVADASGNVYVTGYTNSQFFITTSGAVQGTKNTGYDAFVLKVNTSCAMQWCTFYGGDDDDKGRAIAIDASGTNVYITGSTLAGGFPVTGGVFQNSNADAYNSEDAFILKISTAQVVQFATYCGGNGSDFGQGIAVDNARNIFVTGYTTAADFPIVNPGNGAYVDSTIGSIGTHDGFIVECNSSGTTRTWSTYFGGSSPDMAFAAAYDPVVGLYICGNTASTDFPVQQPADMNYYQSVQGDAGSYNDMFIAWFDINDSLRWSTYYGDANGNEAYGICTDAMNNIFVTGVDSNEVAALKFGPGVPTTVVGDPPIYWKRMLFPNPATENATFFFEINEEGEFTLEIFDMQGRKVESLQHTVVKDVFDPVTFNVSSLAKGLYQVRVSSAAKTDVYPLIKE